MPVARTLAATIGASAADAPTLALDRPNATTAQQSNKDPRMHVRIRSLGTTAFSPVLHTNEYDNGSFIDGYPPTVSDPFTFVRAGRTVECRDRIDRRRRCGS